MPRNKIGYDKKGHQKIPAPIAYGIVALLAGGTLYAAAVLYPIVVSDSLLIVDEPLVRTPAADMLDPQADGYNNQNTIDDLGSLDSTALSTAASEDVNLSDSAQAMSNAFYQISVSSTVGLTDSPFSGIAASDSVDLMDKKSLSTSPIDGFSLFGSVSRGFILLISDSLQISDGTGLVEDEEVAVQDNKDRRSRGDGGGPRRIVYDPTYFESRPLSRMQIGGFDTVDKQGRVVNQLRSGMEVVISVTARNFQGLDQDFVMFAQITDADGIAVDIIQVSGVIDDGEQQRIRGIWIAQPGSFTVSVFLSDGTVHPAVISETFKASLRVE